MELSLVIRSRSVARASCRDNNEALFYHLALLHTNTCKKKEKKSSKESFLDSLHDRNKDAKLQKTKSHWDGKRRERLVAETDKKKIQQSRTKNN